MVKVHNFNGKTISMRKATDLDQNRIRFNWGYHDAHSDFINHWQRADKATALNIMQTHYDSIYARGYTYGWYDCENNLYTGNSDNAWQRAISAHEVIDGITDYNIDHWKAIFAK